MKRLLLLLILSIFTLYTHANIDDDSIRVSLVVAGPGEEIWQLEGHAALRVQIGQNVDMAINYGVFDFKTPNFVYRFVKGETDYLCAAYPFPAFVAEYVATNRRLVEYPLNLNTAESEALMNYLAENLQPENAVYRYNYVKDNCATRPLQLVEKAIGDTLTFHIDPLAGSTTFRDVMRHYHSDYPWYQFGIDLALGSGIDTPISVRDKSFAPVLLDSMIASATRYDGQPAAKTQILLYPGTFDDTNDKSTPWPLTPIAVASYILIVIIAVTIKDIRARHITRIVDAIYMTLIGAIGCIIAFLLFVSTHEATSPNWLIIWLNPLALIVPLSIFTKSGQRLLLYYEIVNFVAIILLVAVWPLTGQTGNIAFIPLIIGDALLSARYIFVKLCAKKAN